MKLYFAPKSRAVRTAWLLYEFGLDFEVERYSIGAPELRTEEYKAINPNSRVPVLEDGDIRITESTAIAQYLVARYGGGKLAPEVSSPDFPVYLQWLHYAEGMIMGHVNNYVVETMILPPERASETHAKRAMKLLGQMVAVVEQHMDGREFLAGGFTAADTVTGHACVIVNRFGLDYTDMPNLKAYVERLQARPAFKKADSL